MTERSDFELDRAQVEAFQTDGFVIVERLVDPGLIDRGLPLLYAQTVYGCVGERLPPQHLPVARRRQPFSP